MSRACPCCGIDIEEPFIRCLQCVPTVDICPRCFARGREFGPHENDHDYEVKQNNFSITNEKWTAAEEMNLLISLLDLGFGNWKEVSKQIQTKSSEECKRHYIEYYVDNPIIYMPSPEESLSNSMNYGKNREVPFKASDHPPRPAPMSDMAIDLAGYMPCRGDFDVEYDNFAETSVKDIEFSDTDDEILRELKFAALGIFHTQLKGRNYRKKIVRRYGLIDVRREISTSTSKQERHIRESLRVFTRLQNPEDNEMLIQGLLLQSNLMKQVKLLQNYRRAGLKRKQAANIYKRLCEERKEVKFKQTMLSEISCHLDVPLSCQLWLQKYLQSNINAKNPGINQKVKNILPQIVRKPAAPLDLTGMPGIELLSNEERELCSQLRIPPMQYANYKNTLVRESQRLGFLRLQQARPLIKIDVNKTKRLFDFFTEQGWINKRKDE